MKDRRVIMVVLIIILGSVVYIGLFGFGNSTRIQHTNDTWRFNTIVSIDDSGALFFTMSESREIVLMSTDENFDNPEYQVLEETIDSWYEYDAASNNIYYLIYSGPNANGITIEVKVYNIITQSSQSVGMVTTEDNFFDPRIFVSQHGVILQQLDWDDQENYFTNFLYFGFDGEQAQETLPYKVDGIQEFDNKLYTISRNEENGVVLDIYSLDFELQSTELLNQIDTGPHDFQFKIFRTTNSIYLATEVSFIDLVSLVSLDEHPYDGNFGGDVHIEDMISHGEKLVVATRNGVVIYNHDLELISRSSANENNYRGWSNLYIHENTAYTIGWHTGPEGIFGEMANNYVDLRAWDI